MKLSGTAAARLSALLMGATCMTPAYAQEQTQDQAAAGEGEIIVTALRRDQNLQDVPAAITAFTSDTIEAAGIERPADFINLTSNVTLVETQNAGNAFIVIRGITQARNSEPSVAVVVDGVQQINPAQFNQDLYDIEQIEVLKGPQGGLYGRNAIGGAIIINTKQPTSELAGSIKGGIDNGFGWYLRGGISGPLSEAVKFRLAGSFYDTDGFIKNTFLGEDADPVKDFSLRGSLLFEPSPGLTIDLRGSMNHLRTQALYFNIVADVNDTSLPVRANNAGQNDRNIYNATLKLNYETEGATFTSITSYDTLSEVLTGDAFDFLPIPESFFFNLFEFLFGAGNGFDLNQSQYLKVKAFSQEFRIASPKNSDSPLNWMVGAYMVDTNRFISTGNMIDTNNGVFPVYRTPSTNPLNPQFSFLSDQQDNFAWAVYANAGYELTEAFRVDASLRYDHDKRKNTTKTPPNFLNGFGQPNGTTGEVRKVSFDDFQPKVTLTYKPSEDLTLYGGYSRGFRSGGFNQTGVGQVAVANGIVGVEDIFKAETVDTFEAGFKANLGSTFYLSGSAYTTTSKNSYFFVFLAANSTQNLGNVPETKINGFELEARWRPVRGMEFNAGYGYTNSKIKAFPEPANTPPQLSVIGNEAPLVSRNTFNLGAQYSGEIGSGIDGLARIAYRRTGKTWWDVPNSTVRKPVELVDARLGLSMSGWSITGFAENLFNEKYNAEFSPGGFVFKARPRRYGVEVGYKF